MIKIPDLVLLFLCCTNLSASVMTTRLVNRGFTFFARLLSQVIPSLNSSFME